MKNIKAGDSVLIKCKVDRIISTVNYTRYYISLESDDSDLGYVDIKDIKDIVTKDEIEVK